jgi:hypothetical protein
MPDVISGDDWKSKNVGYGAELSNRLRKISIYPRARQQEMIDQAYLRGQMTRDEWSIETNLLSQKTADGTMILQ